MGPKILHVLHSNVQKNSNVQMALSSVVLRGVKPHQLSLAFVFYVAGGKCHDFCYMAAESGHYLASLCPRLLVLAFFLLAYLAINKRKINGTEEKHICFCAK